MRTASRRKFLHAGSLALVGTAFMTGLMAETQGKKLFSAVGIATQPDKAAAMKAAGTEFLTVGAGDLPVPDKPEATFETNLAKPASSPLPVLACNSFIRPANLR